MWSPLLLLIVGVSGVYSGHSFQYYTTGVSVPGPGLPQFMSVGYVDGIEIIRYSSDVGRMVPVAPWMQRLEDTDYWEGNTQCGKSYETAYRQHLKILMNRYNQTGGFHSYQVISGCELRDDGSIRVYEQFAYDGKDFTALNTERWVYYPLTDQAQATTQKWNSPEVRQGERMKNYLQTECIDWLKIHLKNGKEELERRVRPEVKVSVQDVNGVTKLHCQVYGFYPRDVDVNWQKNGIDVPLHEAKQVLPNSDGTYQIRVTVEIPAEDREGYSCLVDHASLEEPLTVKWEPQSSSKMLWIVFGVLAGVIDIAAVGFIIWGKRSGKKASSAPTDHPFGKFRKRFGLATEQLEIQVPLDHRYLMNWNSMPTQITYVYCGYIIYRTKMARDDITKVDQAAKCPDLTDRPEPRPRSRSCSRCSRRCLLSRHSESCSVILLTGTEASGTVTL